MKYLIIKKLKFGTAIALKAVTIINFRKLHAKWLLSSHCWHGNAV